MNESLLLHHQQPILIPFLVKSLLLRKTQNMENRFKNDSSEICRATVSNFTGCNKR